MPIGQYMSPITCKSVVVILLTFLTTVQDVNGQDRSRFRSWFFNDAVDFVNEFDRKSPLIAIGAGATLAALSPADPDILGGVQARYNGGLGTFLNVTNRLGGKEIKYPVFSVFAVSLLTDDSRFQDASFTSAQSLVYAGLITSGLKTVFGRARPESGLHEQTFAPFSGRTSFPSGHTTAAFAIVTPWVMYYPGPLTYSLFALSTGTAVARIARDKHWPTDVVAGAAIGFFTGRFLSRKHLLERGYHIPRLRVDTQISAYSVGLSVVYRIG